MTTTSTAPDAGTDGRCEYTITRVFDAPREAVFAAWTEPERFARWFGPREFTVVPEQITMHAEPGGAWQVRLLSPEGGEHPLGGRYLEVCAPGRLVFTTGDPGNRDGAPASVVTVELGGVADVAGGTRMSMHQAGVNTDPAHARAARDGWLLFFDRLAEHLAGHPAGEETGR
ncbi:SRPBCC domain-containing protein [Streptosporangium sp. NPDC048047]|uniref:SRPBCC family protein n=1 Tax=Streptosporangium sp. NPDC048047 TaxID=3155748 RepID=UPI00344828C4